ncbi:MAG: hypothetical protein QMD01_00115 [Thermodesulfovibrionales bacterium]|nr:hypothetical protein [Thermodesulfovibrionales bacterium]
MQGKTLYFYIIAAFIFLLSFQPAYSDDRSADSGLEQKKAQILEDIGTLEIGVSELKNCISRAKTAVELQRCREEIKIRKFHEVQDMLFEMGMDKEERKMKRFPER